MRFWDSSALVPLFVAQKATPTLVSLLAADANLVAWWGTSVECVSALARLEREGGLDAVGLRDAVRRLQEAGANWSEITPTASVRTLATGLLLRHPLRAADALQLAAALEASGRRNGGVALVCLDDRLRVAAIREGLDVLP